MESGSSGLRASGMSPILAVPNLIGFEETLRVAPDDGEDVGSP